MTTMMNRIERESPSFDSWAEVLEAKARERERRDKRRFLLVDWIVILFFAIFLSVAACLVMSRLGLIQ